MEFVQSLGDTSNIPEYAVGGVGRAEIIDDCLVRITLFKPCPTGTDAHIPVCELLWTVPAWIAARAELQQVASEIARRGLDQPARRSPADMSQVHH